MHNRILSVRNKNIYEQIKIYTTQDLHPDFIFIKICVWFMRIMFISDDKIAFILCL